MTVKKLKLELDHWPLEAKVKIYCHKIRDYRDVKDIFPADYENNPPIAIELSSSCSVLCLQ